MEEPRGALAERLHQPLTRPLDHPEDDGPFPLDQHELPSQAMSLTPAQCGALVDDAQTGEGVPDLDWAALEALCRAIEP